MNLDLHKERAMVLAELDQLTTEARHDRIFTAVMETGGSWIGPNSTGSWKTTHQVEIDLLGCWPLEQTTKPPSATGSASCATKSKRRRRHDG